jgi:hypothetical protein
MKISSGLPYAGLKAKIKLVSEGESNEGLKFAEG